MTVSTYLKKKGRPPKKPRRIFVGFGASEKSKHFLFCRRAYLNSKKKVEIFFKVVFSVRIVKKEKVQP